MWQIVFSLTKNDRNKETKLNVDQDHFFVLEKGGTIKGPSLTPSGLFISVFIDRPDMGVSNMPKTMLKKVIK